jgi:hypothetical protein
MGCQNYQKLIFLKEKNCKDSGVSRDLTEFEKKKKNTHA